MIGLYIVGDDDTTLNVTVDTLDQNNSTYNFTTYGQPFGNVFTNMSQINYAGRGGHQNVIFWIFLGLCSLLFVAWLCFIIRKRKLETSSKKKKKKNVLVV